MTELTELQEDIVETAAENPEWTYAEIADSFGGGSPSQSYVGDVVRDNKDEVEKRREEPQEDEELPEFEELIDDGTGDEPSETTDDEWSDDDNDETVGYSKNERSDVGTTRAVDDLDESDGKTDEGVEADEQSSEGNSTRNFHIENNVKSIEEVEKSATESNTKKRPDNVAQSPKSKDKETGTRSLFDKLLGALNLR